MIRGQIKWFDDAKGFGFIESPQGDIFVHYSVIEGKGYKTLEAGQQVYYEYKKADKGLQATLVRTIAPQSNADKL